jgi:hypothetical protein
MSNDLLLWGWGFAAGIGLAPYFQKAMGWAMRKLRCRFQGCPCKVIETEFGISSQCISCGRLIDFVSHKKLREWAKS